MNRRSGLIALAVAAGFAASGCKPWATEDLTALDTAPTYQALAASNDRTCGLGADGQAFCWGISVIGTLLATDVCTQQQTIIGYSIPDEECTKRPLRVAGKHEFTTIASGPYHTLAIDKAGGVWGWGYNKAGVLDNTKLDSAIDYPRQVPGTASAAYKTVAAGLETSCGVTTDGRLFCWGARDLVTSHVQSGVTCATGIGHCVVAPMQIGSATSWKQVAVGIEHACALDTGGTASCWGVNNRNQLGSTTSTTCPDGFGALLQCRFDPAPVNTAAKFTSLAAAGNFTCGVTTTFSVLCWGSAALSGGFQAGTPTSIGAGTWNAVSLGGDGVTVNITTCAVRSDGTLWCFGLSQVGGGTNALRQIAGASGFAGVAVGHDHACAWTSSGEAWCLGDKHNGALGVGDVAYAFVPTLVRVSAPYRD